MLTLAGHSGITRRIGTGRVGGAGQGGEVAKAG
jgi:hypothetical protein